MHSALAFPRYSITESSVPLNVMNLSQVTQLWSSRFLIWNKNNSFLAHIPPSHNAVSKKCHPLTTAFDRLLSFSPGSLALPSGPSRWSRWVARGAVSVVSASSSSQTLWFNQDKPVCPVRLAFLVEGSHFRVVEKKKKKKENSLHLPLETVYLWSPAGRLIRASASAHLTTLLQILGSWQVNILSVEEVANNDLGLVKLF